MTTANAPTIWPIALIASQFTARSNYDCTCAGFVDALMAESFRHPAIKNDFGAILASRGGHSGPASVMNPS
jgi:hypothetical protein